MNNVANKRIAYCSRAERSLFTAALLAVPEPEPFFSRGYRLYSEEQGRKSRS
jgi:hypothetical protein